MTSDSSAASTPLILTPDSTGSPDPPPPPSSSTTSNANASLKKSRRQTAFYPNVNSSNKLQKPFSRSAAKRESVMALGSIEYLQHYFTKTGIVAKKSTLDKKGLVPAIGGLSRIRTNSILSLNTLPELQFHNLPPSPAIPINTRPAYPPYVKTYETNPESLLPGVVEDLTAVARAWGVDGVDGVDGEEGKEVGFDASGGGGGGGLVKADATKDTGNTPTSHFDVLEVLKITTHAVRSIRNYLVSLPDESTGTIRAQFRSKSLGLGPASSLSNKPKSSSGGTTPHQPHQPQQPQQQQQDPLTLIRKSALDVLTVLRELEEGCRLPLSSSAYDDHANTNTNTNTNTNLSDGRGPGSHIRVASPNSQLNSETEEGEGEYDLPLPLPPQPQPQPRTPNHPELGRVHDVDADASVAFSLVRVQGRYESVPVWEDEDGDGEDEDEEDEKRKREYWDERLVLGSGWLYRGDVSLGELGRERGVVKGYLDVVDEVLFQGRTGAGTGTGERGWERERRRVVEKEGRGIARAKGRNSKVSGGDEVKGLGISMHPGEDGDGGNRRVTMGMVDLQISEEPDVMDEFDGVAGEGEDSEASVDDEELPEWAKRSSFMNDELGRIHAIISAFLPPDLLPSLPNPSSCSRTDFLTSLSSGQLLCVAYNACVRKSKKPWGYVNKDSIHDILALERERAAAEGGVKVVDRRTGWTFRRTDNLRLWAGALKLRYLLPILSPSQPIRSGSTTPIGHTPSSSPNPMKLRFPTEHPIMFDAKIVAKLEEGWDGMLEQALLRWVEKVLEERRER